ARRSRRLRPLARRGERHAGLLGEPAGAGVGIAEPGVDVGAEPRDLLRQLRAPSWGLPVPEWHRWRRAVRVLDADASRLDAPDTPGGVAEQKDVPGEALDGEVLV